MRPSTRSLRVTRLSACLMAALGIVATSTDVIAATVTNCTDDDAVGTLRNSVLAATNNEVIDVSGCASITLTQGEIAPTVSVTIAGPPTGATTTIDANHLSRAFRADGGSGYDDMTFSGLTITGGRVAGSGIAYGGCILGVSVTLQRTVVTDCIAKSDDYLAVGGAVDANFVSMQGSRIENSGAYAYGQSQAQGGGVFASNEFHCESSTVSGNTAYASLTSGQGGGLLAFRTVTLDGCTFDSNTARNGGGILHIGFDNTQTMTITNSTVSGNTATNGNGGVYSGQLLTITNSTIANNHASYCGGVYSQAPIDTHSSIIAGNLSDDSDCVDLTSASAVSGANNLVSVVTTAVPGDTIIANPLLTPLADHGGPTFTHGLSIGSPAIDAGSNIDDLATDQRGLAREVNGTADIGAFERQAGDDQLFYGGFD